MLSDNEEHVYSPNGSSEPDPSHDEPEPPADRERAAKDENTVTGKRCKGREHGHGKTVQKTRTRSRENGTKDENTVTGKRCKRREHCHGKTV